MSLVQVEGSLFLPELDHPSTQKSGTERPIRVRTVVHFLSELLQPQQQRTREQ